MMQTAVEHYLRRFAEPEAELAQMLIPWLPRFQHVVVVPAHAEPAGSLELLTDIAQPRTLLIWVVNDPADVSPSAQQRTQRFLKALPDRLGAPTYARAPFSLWARSCPTVLCVDRTALTKPLPTKEGVGTARKIGADVALRAISSRGDDAGFIHSTDADVRLPKDYFEQLTPWRGRAIAATYGFVHIPAAPWLASPIEVYENYLRSYVVGLAEAGSPYAFHTIGSTLAVSATGYATVRGFPKRASAEDFYLLNKLAKVGAIARLDGEPIQIQARLSDRVPIGTGPALAKLNDGQSLQWITGDAWCALAEVFADMAAAAHKRRIDPAMLDRLPTHWHARLLRAFAQGSSADQRLRQLHTFFDGLRTRQFLRDQSLRSHVNPSTTCSVQGAQETARQLANTRVAERRVAAGLVGVPLLVPPTAHG